MELIVKERCVAYERYASSALNAIPFVLRLKNGIMNAKTKAIAFYRNIE